MSQPLWSAVPCYNGSQIRVNGGYPHGENDVVYGGYHGDILFSWGKMTFSWGKMTCQYFMYFGVSYFQTRQSWLWDVMSQHGPKTHRLWWIYINSTLRTIPLHVTGTYFDRFSHDFQMILDPKSFQNDPKNRIPAATWLTGSLGLGTAQRQAASAAERIEGGAMCPRRKFTTFPCWTSYNIVKSSIFLHFFPRSS